MKIASCAGLPVVEKKGLLLVGDPHVADVPPGQRLPGYREQILGKVRMCLEHAEQEGLEPVFLGDLFNWPRDNSNALIVELIELFRPHRPWVLVGNHDKYQARYTDDVSMAVLDAAGVVRLMVEPKAQFLLRTPRGDALVVSVPDGHKLPKSVELGAGPGEDAGEGEGPPAQGGVATPDDDAATTTRGVVGGVADAPGPEILGAAASGPVPKAAENTGSDALGADVPGSVVSEAKASVAKGLEADAVVSDATGPDTANAKTPSAKTQESDAQESDDSGSDAGDANASGMVAVHADAVAPDAVAPDAVAPDAGAGGSPRSGADGDPCAPQDVILLTHHNIRFPEFEDRAYSIKELPGVTWLINGHIHRPQPTVKKGMTTWANPGNITRLTFSRRSLERIPAAAVWQPGMDDLEKWVVPHLDFYEVFPEQDFPPEDAPGEDGESRFLQGLERLAWRRTREGAGLKRFLSDNLDPAEPETELIWKLYEEAVSHDE